MAKLSEQAERFDDMVTFMKKVANKPTELTVDERNLLSVAYKNVVGTRRGAWRILTSVKDKEESRGNEKQVARILEFRGKVEKELKEICADVLGLLKTKLVPSATSPESKVFFYKMVGDYHRYLCEFLSGDERSKSMEEAKEGYTKAYDVGVQELPPTHPIRLGLALNFSVFYYEVISSPDEACKMAKTAFDDAIAELDSLTEDSYKDSTLIMQLLRDNLTLWTSETEQQGA